MVLRSRAWAAAADLPSAIDAAAQAGPAGLAGRARSRWRRPRWRPGTSPRPGRCWPARRWLTVRRTVISWRPGCSTRSSDTGGGDRDRGRRSLGHALRLAEPEQFRLPFALERGWLRPVLRLTRTWPAPTAACSSPTW